MVGWVSWGRVGNPEGVEFEFDFEIEFDWNWADGGQGWGPVLSIIIQCMQCSPVRTYIPHRAGSFHSPVHAMIPRAHLETSQGWDINIGGLLVHH